MRFKKVEQRNWKCGLPRDMVWRVRVILMQLPFTTGVCMYIGSPASGRDSYSFANLSGKTRQASFLLIVGVFHFNHVIILYCIRLDRMKSKRESAHRTDFSFPTPTSTWTCCYFLITVSSLCANLHWSCQFLEVVDGIMITRYLLL